MKIHNNFNNRQNLPAFNGLVSGKILLDLKKQNTSDSLKLLKSCLGFNAVYRGAEDLNPDKIARDMQNKFKIGTDFGNNPLIAACSALTANIFHKLGYALPSNVYLKDLSKTWYSNTLGICCTSTYDYDILNKFGKNFPLRSVVFNADHNWDSIQDYMINAKRINHSSTGHFLDVFIHEFMHSAHLANLQNRYGNKGKTIMSKFQRNFENKDTIIMIQKETSNYGATKPCEMIAEEMTELIVDSLNPKTLMPDEMIFRMNRFKEPFKMDKLIDACWNGNVEQVEIFRKKRNSLVKFLENSLGLNRYNKANPN